MSESERRLDDPDDLAQAVAANPLWRDLFEAAPAPYALFDIASGRLVGNDAYCRQLGYTPDELAQLPPGVILDPDDVSAAAVVYEGLLEGRVPSLRPPKRYVRKDGSRFWGEATVSPLRDPAGRTWALLSCVQDVTERVEAQRALHASEARFRALLQNAADAVVLLDDALVISYASPPAARMLHVRTGRLVGSAAFDFVHPEDLPTVIEALAGTPRPPEVGQPTRFRIVAPDGDPDRDVRWVEAIATDLRDDPAVGGFVVNIRDVTDNEEVIDALAVLEHRYRKMLANISDVVFLVTVDGRVLATAGSVSSILGYDAEFWVGRSVFDLVHPDDIDPDQRLLRELLADAGGSIRAEVRMRAAAGNWVDVEIDAVNLLDDPDVAALVVTARDVSDRKQVERELASARDQALQALADRTEFVASVSHELRTPVHGILGLTELLVTAPGLDDATADLARSVSRATESLRMVLDDILDFSRIEAGRLEVDRRPLSVPAVVADVVALAAPQAQAKGIGLDTAVDPAVPRWVLLDELRLRQVLSNLVGNAVKFTDEGGVAVRVRVQPGEDGPGTLRISVADTGIGIATDELDRLFEPFSQAHRSTAQEFGGTGLGLSIVRRLVQLMGGGLTVDSEPGVGSTFTVELPLQPVSEPVGPTPATPRRPRRAEPRVLVVEDNPINQLLVRRQLERMGCAAVVVGDGAAALDQVADVDPDLVLMDWQLPDLDGLETTRRLRLAEQRAGRPPVPIVAMTASALPGDRARCLEAGMDDFLAKPVGMAVLASVLERWVGLPSGGAPRPPSATDPGGAPPARLGPVDPAVLDRLVDELGDANLVADVVRTFLRELDGRVEAVAEALDANDNERLLAALHTLKSTSAAVGADELSEWSRRTEQLAAVTSAAPRGASAPVLRTQARAVRSALEAEVARLSG